MAADRHFAKQDDIQDISRHKTDQVLARFVGLLTSQLDNIYNTSVVLLIPKLGLFRSYEIFCPSLGEAPDASFSLSSRLVHPNALRDKRAKGDDCLQAQGLMSTLQIFYAAFLHHPNILSLVLSFLIALISKTILPRQQLPVKPIHQSCPRQGCNSKPHLTIQPIPFLRPILFSLPLLPCFTEVPYRLFLPLPNLMGRS